MAEWRSIVMFYYFFLLLILDVIDIPVKTQMPAIDYYHVGDLLLL